MSDVDIPRVVYGNPSCRLVLYSHNSSDEVNNLNTALNASQEDVALANLRALIRDSSSGRGSGVELETDGESDLMGVQWAKAIDAPAGVMNISLKPRKDYASLIQPDDVILAFMRSSKYDKEYFITLLSVDSVVDQKDVGGSGATISMVHVQGRDLGKVLMETPTVFDSAFGGLTVRRFFEYFLAAFQAEVVFGGPSRVIQVMLSVFYSLRQNFVTLTTGQAVPSDSSVVDLASQSVERPLRLWGFPGHPTASMLSFLDIKNFVQTPMVGSTTVAATLLQSQGNLWSLCDMYANRLVNEFFVDVRDLTPGYADAHLRHAAFAERILAGASAFRQSSEEQKAQAAQLDAALVGVDADLPGLAPEQTLQLLNRQDFDPKTMPTEVPAVVALVHRQMPYDTLSFYSLPATVVYETEVKTCSLVKSAHDVVNLFRLRFPGLVETVAGARAVLQDLMFGVTINRDSIARHGIRSLQAESIYPFIQDPDFEGSPNFALAYEYYMSLLTCWYAYNDRMYSGSMSMRLRPDIRVGTRLTFVRTHAGQQQVFDLYVQNVQQSFSPMPGQSRTTVQVVRGIKRADGTAVGDQPEAYLFWSNVGRMLKYDPYEVVVSADLQPGAQSDPDTVTIDNIDPPFEENL